MNILEMASRVITNTAPAQMYLILYVDGGNTLKILSDDIVWAEDFNWLMSKRDRVIIPINSIRYLEMRTR